MIEMIKKMILFSLALTSFRVAWSQTPARSLKIKDLLLKVSEHSPSLITDSALVKTGESEFHQANYNWLPSLGLNYQANLGTNNNLPGGYFSYGMVPSNSRVRNTGNASTILTDLGIVAFNWEVYNFGAYKAEQNAAESDLKVKQAEFTQSKYNQQAIVINDYLQLLLVQQLLVIQQLNIDRTIEIRKSIQSLAKSGIIAGVDTSIAEAELSKSRLNYLELENQYQQIRLQLASISGIPANEIIADTLLTNNLNRDFYQLSVSPSDTGAHPLLLFAKAQYENNKLKEEFVKKQYNPKVYLMAALWGRGSSVTADDQFKKLPDGLGFTRGNYLAGVGVSYDLFNGRKRRLELDVQRSYTAYAAKKMDEENAILKLGFQQADAEVEAAKKRMEEIPKQLIAARAAYRQKFSLYKNGLNDIVDLNAALNILYRAETDFIIAENKFCKAIFQKAFMENKVDLILELSQ